MLRTAFVVVVALVLLLHTMSVMGLDLAPLLATAGVIGIAIGFGSQKLVQDVINGMFILLQDTISVGDVVEVGGHGGTVERMSVRTIELRDASGIVHTIPFSEITTVKNWARGFGYAELDVSVAYGEDADEVMEVLRQISAELEADPQVGQFMLEPIDVWGVDELAETGVLIKARIKTRPLKQFYVKRQFNRLMKRRFDELGIAMPSRLQTVYLMPDQAETAAPESERARRARCRARARARRRTRRAARGQGARRAVARSRVVLRMARPSTLRRQLHQASRERQRRILDFRVERVLSLLKDDNLATRAALDLNSKDGILLECNFVNEVWEDVRVAARIRQLGERGVTVEPVTYEFEVAGRSFARSQIRVRF